MNINNKELLINFDLTMNEVRLVQYALKKLNGNSTLIDVQLIDIENVTRDFTNVLRDNFVSEIMDEQTEVKPNGIDIL